MKKLKMGKRIFTIFISSMLVSTMLPLDSFKLVAQQIDGTQWIEEPAISETINKEWRDTKIEVEIDEEEDTTDKDLENEEIENEENEDEEIEDEEIEDEEIEDEGIEDEEIEDEEIEDEEIEDEKIENEKIKNESEFIPAQIQLEIPNSKNISGGFLAETDEGVYDLIEENYGKKTVISADLEKFVKFSDESLGVVEKGEIGASNNKKTSPVQVVSVGICEYKVADNSYLMIDHIILKYSSNVKLPTNKKSRKALFTLWDSWANDKRAILNVYTNSKPKTVKNNKSKAGKYVIIQFQKKMTRPTNKYSQAKYNYAGWALKYDQQEQKYYRRTDYSKTMLLKQNKNVYSSKGKLISKKRTLTFSKKNIYQSDMVYPKRSMVLECTLNAPEYCFSYPDRDNMGTIESVSYQSKDYYRKDGKVYKKKANVYLPAGYYKNTKKKYPILYFMHGTSGSEDGYEYYVRFLDRMIAEGLIEPMIVAFPSFYTNNPQKDRNIGFHQQDVYDQEFRNDLMKAVEGKYRTYAKSTSDADLMASRDYRAFTGYSAGGFITWQTFLDNADYVRNFIPLAGFLTNMYREDGSYIPHNEAISMAIDRASDLKSRGLDYEIIECCGTVDDQMTEKTKYQLGVLSSRSDVFPVDKYRVIWIKNEGHSYNAFVGGIFYALPQLFPGTYYKK